MVLMNQYTLANGARLDLDNAEESIKMSYIGTFGIGL